MTKFFMLVRSFFKAEQLFMEPFDTPQVRTRDSNLHGRGVGAKSEERGGVRVGGKGLLIMYVQGAKLRG